mgnify:CR=1 FL=1
MIIGVKNVSVFTHLALTVFLAPGFKDYTTSFRKDFCLFSVGKSKSGVGLDSKHRLPEKIFDGEAEAHVGEVWWQSNNE